MLPTVSILLAAWNASKTIEAAIDSALGQKGCHVQVVVIDDASTDDTVPRAAAMSDAVRIVRLAENGGPGAARNAGLKACEGDWIALLDADDRFLPDRLRRLIEAAREGDYDLVADRLVMTAPDGRTLGIVPDGSAVNGAAEIDAVAFAYGNGFLQGGSNLGYLKPMVRRDFLERTGVRWPVALRVAEDFHFAMSCLLAGGRYAMIPEALYAYAVTPGSLSRSLDRAEMARIVAESARFLASLDPRVDRDVRRALEWRHRSFDLALAHREIVDLVKARRGLKAIGRSMARPAVLHYVAKYGMEGIVKRLGRLAQRRD